MPHRRTAAALVAAATVFLLPAHAASGSLDSFNASATEVMAGSWVDFSVGWSVFTSASAYGGSNPIEPEPREGYQEWNVNWYNTQSEAATSVSLQIGGESTTEFLSAPAGSSSYGGWTVSIFFPSAGRYTVAAGGSWAGEFDSYYSYESAYRNCYAVDPDYGGALQCDGWTWTYSDGGDRYAIGDSFSSQSLTINVTAVPEPATLALWLAGAALLTAQSRRRARSA